VALLIPVITSSAQLRLDRQITLTPPYGGFSPSHPIALTLSPEDNIYLLDTQLSCIARLSLTGVLITQAGGPGTGDQQFSDPQDLSIYSGLDLFVADRGNDRIVRLNRRLTFLSEFHSLDNTSPDLAFEKPLSVVQNARGDLFIADGGNDRILKISADGEPLFSFGAYGEEKGSLAQPRRLEPDPVAGLWVLDSRGHAVHFDEFGGYVEEVHAVLSGHAQGLAISAEAVWVCSDSSLWTWDRESRQPQIFSSADLGIPDTVSLVDLAIRAGQLWIMDSSGALYHFQFRIEP
jgi:tripartite motif-containing protein 71